MKSTAAFDVQAFVSARFQSTAINVREIDVRHYPDESIVVVRVAENDMQRAIELANDLDKQLAEREFDGFVTVKKAAKSSPAEVLGGRVRALSDERVASLVNLLTARARTTELQPSLSYIPDVKNNIASATSPRHHLVFGRRGSGKTALLAETKRVVEQSVALSIWMNIQTYRHENAGRTFLAFCQRLSELIQRHYKSSPRSPQVLVAANTIYDEVNSQLASDEPNEVKLRRMIPRVQSMTRRFLETNEVSLYVFLDDFHYLDTSEQPLLLDMIHGCVRDCDAWLKVAAIQHLTRWFDPGQQLGLQTGHDAAHIDLDITLQDPKAAKSFLEQMLRSYARHCGIDSISQVFSQSGALDRLVLASGAVPRDYLTLCSSSIQQAKQRQNAKQVGVQDVNKAAGDAKQKKLDELEDDAASTEGESQEAIQTLQTLRQFCIDDRNWTYFRVDFREKEQWMAEYTRLQVLTDLRLIHLIEPSLSDEHRAGHRAEVYMLDLSQFAGHRLKRRLNVLDFVEGHFVLKQTGTRRAPRVGNTANKRLSLLRRAPLFPLESLVGSR